MTDIMIIEDTSIIRERYECAIERIAQIEQENSVPKPFRDYFKTVASFILMLDRFAAKKEEIQNASLIDLQKWNHRLYEDILPEHYEQSYGNPEYAVSVLGKEYGQILSAVYAEIRGMIVYVFEDSLWDMTVLCELFLELYNDFEQEDLPLAKDIKQIFYWYVSDYSDDMIGKRILQSLDPKESYALSVLESWDLSDLRYLYQYGEYVSENELKMAAFLNTLPQLEIDAMARTYTEGYRIGFITTRKDITKKKTVNIRYNLGFERMVLAAVKQFRAMGLEPILYRYATHLISKRQHIRIGYQGANPNKQYDFDHKNDIALVMDEDFVQRKLRVLQYSYEKYKDLAAVHGGPAVIEIFGEKPFVPVYKKDSLSMTEHQQKMQVTLDNQSGQITNRYIKGEERSFTIIAYPVPEIGDRFEEIFKDIVKINNLDYKLYEQIQQTIIDALDKGTAVHIKGVGTNRTDLIVQLRKMDDPKTETLFENCVADVNIPVGEVFTTPVLRGTNGTLHVSKVYLNELQYKDLCIWFENGKVKTYECGNFSSKEENQTYIRENILYHHASLPMGEFAIGTNTTAYVVAQKHGIQEKLPILIAEKMGPHFALGDTCYSWAEDTPVYNQNGKEIIARDNEVSIQRKDDLDKAYYGCHTDITIPYEELEYIKVIQPGGDTISIIENGRFVLPGTEVLNEPFTSGV